MRAGALERLVPPWSGVRIERSLVAMHEGAEAVLSIPVIGGARSPLRVRWVARHTDIVPDQQFVDVMTKGPLPYWRHTHRFLAAEDRPQPAARLEDEISWKPLLGPIGATAAPFMVRMLRRTFDWRHRRLRNDLRRHAELTRTPLTIAVSGASGLIGSALCAFLTTGGHTVRRLVRKNAGAHDVAWDIEQGTIDHERLEGVDAVVHLAGESIAGRWTDAKRKAILESRVRGTDLLARTIAKLRRPPGVFVSASAVGYYGDRGAEPIDESSPRGSGFLADVCAAWEQAASPARDAGIRTVHPRTGMVLAANGGALQQLVLPFSFGLGGPVGSGSQGISWIALDDLIASILFAIVTPAIDGPYNAVGPQPVSNRAFGHALGRVLRRPAIAPLPGFVVKTIFGDMGRELLLAGAFVQPRRLLDAGFRFDANDAESALRFALGR